MMAISGYEAETKDQPEKLVSGYDRGSLTISPSSLLQVKGSYDPMFVIGGSPAHIENYRSDAQRFFRDVVATISHETIHVVVAWRLLENFGEWFSFYRMASKALDYPILHGDEGESLDVCGLNMSALINWMRMNEEITKRSIGQE